MIERYTVPEIKRIFSDEYKFQKWLEVELCACEAQYELGHIPKEAWEEIRSRATVNPTRVVEIEQQTRHDVIAFLTALAEQVGEASRYIHLGMTSSDVLDTALAMQLKEACQFIIDRAERLKDILISRAREHKYTVMMGRTHGVHAEPVTLGLKFALWAKEMERNIERMRHAQRTVSVGKISGAVGTFANIDPRVESLVMEKLGLAPAPISSQVVQRDRHAEYMCALAIMAGSLEKFATEIRNLQRTEIREVEEPFGRGQKGSSAMPHKRNPITCERVTGLARVVRSYTLTALENQSLWHERDLTQSSAERIIIPDATMLVAYMLIKLTEVIEGLVVYPEAMRKNLELTRGVIFSQQVLLKLVDKGLTREKAYEIVQARSMEALERGVPLKDLLAADPVVSRYIAREELEEAFRYDYHLKYVDYIFRRAGIET